MLRVTSLKRFATMPVMAKRALSAGDGVLSKYGIVPATSTKVFRNLSYDDIHAQGELRIMSCGLHRDPFCHVFL